MSKPDFHVHWGNRAARTTVVALAIGWFIVDAILTSPDFGHTDIYYFKDAGINFAEGLGLTTRFTYGNATFSYRDYAHYPPIYPLIFGLYQRMTGISAPSNQAFNTLVGILVGIMGFIAIRGVVSSAAPDAYRGRIDTAVAVAAISTGYYGFAYDRPDGLAVTLGIASLLLAIRGNSTEATLTAGTLCVLTLFTSPFTGIWTAAGAGIGILARHSHRPRIALRQSFIFGGSAALAACGCLILLRIELPGWFATFFGVATGSETHNETGAGYFLALLRGDVRTWWSGFGYAGPESALPLLKLCAAAAGVGLAALSRCRCPGQARRAGCLFMLLVAAPLGLVTAPYQTNYALITAALLLATWAGIEMAWAADRAEWPSRTVASAMLIAFAVNVAATVPFEARNILVRWNTGASLQRALAYLNANRNLLEGPGRYTAVSPTNYIVWRQAGLHPLINTFSGFREPVNREKLAVLALGYPGSGNMSEAQPADFIAPSEYTRVFAPGLPQPATVLGFVLANSSQTWESAIYQRRP